MAEMLSGMVATASVMLALKEGRVVEVVEAIGSTLRTTHMDGYGIRAYFGRRPRVEGAEVLERISRKGVTMEIRTGGDLASKPAYRNHRSAAKYGVEVQAKAAVDAALGRDKVFPVTQTKSIVGLLI